MSEFLNLSMPYQVRHIFEFNCKSTFNAEASARLQEHDLPITPSALRTALASHQGTHPSTRGNHAEPAASGTRPISTQQSSHTLN